MLSINLDLDLEDGLDEIDVLGDLRISDGHSTIVVKTTYVDSWLEELIEAAKRLSSEGHIQAVAPEESVPIQLELDPGKCVTISRQGQIVIADSMSDFHRALNDAAKLLLDAVGNLPRSRINKSLDIIREYYLSG